MVDVGAAGGILPRWSPFRKEVCFVGLEPDERSSIALRDSEQSTEFANYRIVPLGAWDKKAPLPISFTRKPTCSSHFQPNRGFLDRFQNADRYDVTGSALVDCDTLDNLLADPSASPDILKLDLEGGELAVLAGAERILETCLALHVEVSFQHLRRAQPLFGEIRDYLASKGIEFMDFLYLRRWERDSGGDAGQCVFGDALFLRSPEEVLHLIKAGKLQAPKVKTYLAILLVYERYDLALTLLTSGDTPELGHNYIDRALQIVRSRKQSFERRMRRLQELNIVVGSLYPNSAAHYLF